MLPQYLCNLKEKHAVLKPRRSRSLHAVALSVLLTFVLICICHQLLEPVNQDSQHHHNQHPDKAVAVVQYDSPDRISLLDCYLKVHCFRFDLLITRIPITDFLSLLARSHHQGWPP